MDTLAFFQNLKPEDWSKQVNKKWTVKDTLAHLMGWQKEVAQQLPIVWQTQKLPWFMENEGYHKFNDEIYERYKEWTPEKLMPELEHWEKTLQDEIQKIGEDNIRNREHMSWVFDEGGEPHFEHHINLIEKALETES